MNDSLFPPSCVPPCLCAAVRPGVLVLEVLDVREECSMQLARCEQRRPPGGETAAATRLLVLSDRETSAQLRPAPRDVIHVYPPW